MNDEDQDLLQELLTIMDNKKNKKIKVGEWKNACETNCCPQAPVLCCPPPNTCCPPQQPCAQQCDYQQDMIKIQSNQVKACDQECEEYEDDDYQIDICQTGGNMHVTTDCCNNASDLLQDSEDTVVTQCLEPFINISVDQETYDKIMATKNFDMISEMC